MLEDKAIIWQSSICNLKQVRVEVEDDHSVSIAQVSLPVNEVVPTCKRNAPIDKVNNKGKICSNEDEHKNGNEHSVHFWWEEAHQKIPVDGHDQNCHQPRGCLEIQNGMFEFLKYNCCFVPKLFIEIHEGFRWSLDLNHWQQHF